MKILLLLIFAATMMANATHQLNPENEVKRSVERFYSHFSKGEYEQMWGCLSSKLKEGNDHDKNSYVKSFPNSRSVVVTVEIKNVKILGTEAKVILTQRFAKASEKRVLLEEEHEDRWVYEDGVWLYDGTVLLNEK